MPRPMNTHSTQPDLTKRHIRYIDVSVQKWLLIALVALEILLVTGALWVLYLQLIGTVEANLYRAHSVGKPDIYPLLQTALIGLGSFLIINLIALWIADRLWARRLKLILQPFMELMHKAEKLDFSADAQESKPHKVVELAHIWRTTERQRLINLRTAINQLNTSGGALSPAGKEHMRATLETILKLLP